MPKTLFDNTNQFQRIRYRYLSYLKISLRAARQGVSIPRVIASRFPYAFKDNKKPATLSIELTDACDLKCVYCNNPLFAKPRKFMTDEVLKGLLISMKKGKFERVRIGGGEPTLHPKFEELSSNIKKHSKFMSIVSNAQWRKESIMCTLLNHYDLIEISVDAGGKEVFEKSRIGASYELLLFNISRLNELKTELKSKAHINIRFMIRPSNEETRNVELDKWKSLCNSVMPQFVIKHAESDYQEDVFRSKQIEEDSYPKCTLPFKDLQVRANGDIPMCQITGSTIIKEKKRIIGNVKNDLLLDIWNGEELKKIRNAHRNRVYEDMDVCKGCRST